MIEFTAKFAENFEFSFKFKFAKFIAKFTSKFIKFFKFSPPLNSPPAEFLTEFALCFKFAKFLTKFPPKFAEFILKFTNFSKFSLPQKPKKLAGYFGFVKLACPFLRLFFIALSQALVLTQPFKPIK